MSKVKNALSIHLETGKQGETHAAAFLEKKGWNIVERNWQARRGEIDIIAWENEKLLVFVEVKTRSGEGFGGPEGAINAHKQAMLSRTAGLYMESIGYEWEIRFDTIAVIMRDGRLKDLRHVEDVFFPTQAT